jgi:hypothetical protein
MLSVFLQRDCVGVQKVLEDVGSIRGWLVVVEPVNGRVARFVWACLINPGDVRVWYPTDWFFGISGGR